MHAKLKEFLRSKGVSEAQLDKIERGEVPSPESGVLRKGATDDEYPWQADVRKCHEMLDEIKSSVDDILKADAHRVAAARGAELFANGVTNGHALDLPNFLSKLARGA
jgi:hypothetical protein